MTTHCPDEYSRRNVVHLDRSARESHGEMRSVLGELDAADVLVSLLGRGFSFCRSHRAKKVDFSTFGVPDVDALAESNGDEVARGPVEEVEVVVVDETRGVEDSFRGGGDATTSGSVGGGGGGGGRALVREASVGGEERRVLGLRHRRFGKEGEDALRVVDAERGGEIGGVCSVARVGDDASEVASVVGGRGSSSSGEDGSSVVAVAVGGS